MLHKIKHNYIVSILLLLGMWFASAPLYAQVAVEARIDSIAILIGQQAHINLQVTAPSGARIIFPKWEPRHNLTSGVEIVEVGKTDTLAEENGKINIQKQLTITSFDEKLYPIPAFTVKVNGTNYKSNSLALKVINVDVDTLHLNKFYPPKPVQDNPFLWSEWLWPFLASCVALLLIAAAVYVWGRLRNHKPIIQKVVVIQKIPPHQKALAAIEQIKTQHLPTSENQKEYYTRLTNTLRLYIEERFGFNAMEMTSDEIIIHLQKAGDKAMLTELRNLFYTADLVKFAKHASPLNENDTNLVNAIQFIDTTKTNAIPKEERIVAPVSDKEKESRRAHRLSVGLLVILVTAGVALAIYAVYQVYQLVM